MVHGKTQNIQGFLSDSPVIIVEHTTPYGYRLSVEYLLTKVTCPAMSTDTNTKETAYYDVWRDPQL